LASPLKPAKTTLDVKEDKKFLLRNIVANIVLVRFF
jgi:hypothetical protein